MSFAENLQKRIIMGENSALQAHPGKAPQNR